MKTIEQLAQTCLDIRGYIVIAQHISKRNFKPGDSGITNMGCGHISLDDGVDVRVHCLAETTLEDFEVQCLLLGVPAFMPGSNPTNFRYYRMIAE